MPKPPVDNESDLVKEVYAVIYSPRRTRDRFPENCVTVHESMQAALAASDPDKQHYAARVIGPCRSSEGFMLYYLDHWLE